MTEEKKIAVIDADSLAFYAGHPNKVLDDDGELMGDFFYFSQDNYLTPNGEYTIDVSSLIGPNAYVNDVFLAGIGYNWNSEECFYEDHEFAVAGLNTNPVPEPATMLLFGTGLIGLAGIGRKKFF